MGNQQMAYSNHQPPTVEDPNEWYDSVSEVEERKEQVTSPGNNVVVNGILDELVDSLFESKLANSSNENLPIQHSPEDEQRNGNNQTSPSTYEDVAPNWKQDASAPESERSDPIPSGKFIPSSNDLIFRKDVPVSAEKDVQNLTNIRNTLTEAINESVDRERLCNDDTSQEITNEYVKELCIKSDSVIPLPCPENCEVSRNATTNDNIKAFELTPRDVETINQSGKFCELFCDSKESRFQVSLEAMGKNVTNNCDEDASQDPESVEALNTNQIIRDGEAILEKTALYLEELNRNTKHNVEKENLVDVTSDPSGLQLNVNLETNKDVIPNLKETVDQNNKSEDVQVKQFTLEGLYLPEELHVASLSNTFNNAETSLENINTINSTLDESQLLVVFNPLSNKKFPDEINESAEIKQPIDDVIRIKQQNPVCFSDSTVGSTEERDELLINSKDIVSATNSTNVEQHDTKQDEYNVGELNAVCDNLEADAYSAEMQDSIIKSEEKCNILMPVSNFGNSANESLDSPLSTISADDQSLVATSETLRNAVNTPSVTPTDVLEDETIHLETEKVTEVRNCDSVNNIPLIDKVFNTCVSLTGDSTTPSFDNETNSTAIAKNLDIFNPPLQETKVLHSFAKMVPSQNEEGRENSIEANSSVTENLNTSPLNEMDMSPEYTERDSLNDIEPTPHKPLVGALSLKSNLPCSEGEKIFDVNPSDSANNIIPVDDVLAVEDSKMPHQISSPTVHLLGGEISCMPNEEKEKFQSFEKEVDRHQHEEMDRKCVDLNTLENLDAFSTSTANNVELPSNIAQNKTVMENTSCNPIIKSSLGVTNAKEKSISCEMESNVEVEQNGNSNGISPVAEFSDKSSSFVGDDKKLPLHNSKPLTPLTNTNMTCKLIEEREKIQSCGKGQFDYRQREKAKEVCSNTETLENISESTKKAEGATVLPESRSIYEEENICDLDEVINQFRHKHNLENVESYSKLDRRKELLDKLNARKPTPDKRKNPGKNMERSSFQPTGECRKDARVSNAQNKNIEEIPTCLKKHEFKLPSISQNEVREQNLENIVQKEDFVNFRGNLGVEEQKEFIEVEQPNGPKKKSFAVVREVEKTDVSNKGNLKKERMPELKPETLKSLIADLSLAKSTTEVGCNTTEDWTKRDVSKSEVDWLKEKKKLVSRITNLHETQNATKFIVKELIFLVTSWMEGKDKDNVDLQETRQKLINERDQALEDLRSVEESFYELHRRYEKTKKLIEDYKKNEDILRKQISEGEERLQQQKLMFDELVKHSEVKIEQANAEILNLGKSRDSEIAVLTAQLRKAEMKAKSLEKALEQKVRENTELSSICEDLITKCGRK